MTSQDSTLECSRWLCGRLRDLAFKHGRRWSPEANAALVKILFTSLFNKNQEYFDLLFPGGHHAAEKANWKLSAAQGARDGAEYTEAARGKRCGHIFKNGEASYGCRTCATDPTCVLCARCFEASDHEGHQIIVTTSMGSAGCCDCGDDEAWVRPVNCSIHTAHGGATVKAERGEQHTVYAIPDNLQDSIRTTISRALDFVCDTFSCAANERMRNLQGQQGEKLVRDNELFSRLKGQHYRGTDQTELDDEFCLILWNDEKHTLDEVTDNVAKALKQRKSYGRAKAREVDDLGRSIIDFSRNVPELLKKAQVLERIKVTVTIRSTRDTFREMMCGTIIEWLSDIAGCSVGEDHSFLMNTVCEEMLKPWRMGSGAVNLEVGKGGISDQAQHDDRLQERQRRRETRMFNLLRAGRNAAGGTNGNAVTVTAMAGITPGEVVNNIPAIRAAFRVAAIEAEREDSNSDDGDDDNINIDFDEGAGDDFRDFVVETGTVDPMELDDSSDEGDVVRDGTDDDDLDADELAQREQEATNDAAWGTGTLGRASGNPRGQFPAGASGTEGPASQSNQDHLITQIPRTPRAGQAKNVIAPPYWSNSGPDWTSSKEQTSRPIYEDLSRRVRVDFMILYDLRMWKQLRTDLRFLYIRTIITVPYFKRVLGLRFASIYTYLAQLYLIADREPDYSIINLSLQMLTTPSITNEIIDRGNFLTKLLAIFYTFLTKRQVDHPQNVDLSATMSLDSQVTSNRRVYHFFNDMRYLLDSKHVQKQIRMHDEYLQQCIDFIKLYQGVCPNVRVLGEHVEYESDLWINASIVGRDITKMTRHFCEAFVWSRNSNPDYICRAIRQAAKATTINSMGAERNRFQDADFKRQTSFEQICPYSYDHDLSPIVASFKQTFKVVRFVVENEPMSFHHTLHFMLSWLIDCGKSMSRDQLRQLMIFDHRQLEMADLRSPLRANVPVATEEQYLLALFDVPLRVCAWLAQMRAGMWVRNGMALRHQMSTVRNVGNRDNSHQRDLFLLQVALATVPPDTFLVSAARRFGMTAFLDGQFQLEPTWQDEQYMDVAEDFIHLLIVLLSDRTLLLPLEEEPNAQELIAKKDIAHALCFKPLSHSELVSRLSERVTQEMDNFALLVQQMTTYRAPEGLQDTGTFELKAQFYDEIDPYNAWYTKNQREEAENIWRQRKAKQLGTKAEDMLFEPKLRSIRTGVFSSVSNAAQNPIFGKVIWNCLSLLTGNVGDLHKLPASRFEAFLHPVLYLMLIAISEDSAIPSSTSCSNSFLNFAIWCRFKRMGSTEEDSILALLLKTLQSDHYEGIRPKLRLVMHRIREKRPQVFDQEVQTICARLSFGDPIELLEGRSKDASSATMEDKKRKALERNARVMANMKAQQKEFEKSQAFDWGLDASDIDSDEDMITEESSAKTWHFPEGTCIFCQENTNEQKLYGTLAFICESSLFRETNLEDVDYVQEAISTPQNLDRNADYIRPYGVAGQNVQQIQKVRADGTTIVQEVRGLGRGFPSQCHEKGTVATGCGHLMHFSCFETYLSATARRQHAQITRDHPERAKLKEFVCPLCKALGNAFFPIIWKPKALVGSQNIQSGTFEQFLTGTVPFLMSTGAEYPQYAKIHQNYIAETLVPGLAAKVADSVRIAEASNTRAASPHPAVARPARESFFQIPEFLSTSDREAGPSGLTGLAQMNAAGELLKAYTRLNDTMLYNKLFFRAPKTLSAFIPESLMHSDVLASSLGFSISSTEIAQRGMDSKGPTFLSSIAESQLTHLRIQSETASTYVAIGGIHNSTLAASRLPSIVEPKDTSTSQVHQLLAFTSDASEELMGRTPPLLTKDIFVFLVECSVFMVPHLHLGIQDILRLCYLAEIVKVVVAYLQNPAGAWQQIHTGLGKVSSVEALSKTQCSPEEGREFSAFVQQIWDQMRHTSNLNNEFLDDPNKRYPFDIFLRAAVNSYILPFLRKSLLLMHVRYSVDFTANNTIDANEPERVRLTKLLGLPSLDRFISSMNTTLPVAAQLHRLVQHWIGHSVQHFARLQNRQGLDGAKPLLAGRSSRIQLPHPAIFELVALPHTYDLLNAEAMTRRCPTSGKDLIDASICLFCGDIFCGQAQCCSIIPHGDRNERYGGCMQHQAKCAGNVGMFLNIRKCAALLNNEKQGTWLQAPYLDEHGETDMGLRRRNQLFLNMKRYDKLFRDIWLNHGIPSAISRKLEADVNNGGWETI